MNLNQKIKEAKERTRQWSLGVEVKWPEKSCRERFVRPLLHLPNWGGRRVKVRKLK